jgi:uncharacterized HAD superfamily protein
MLIATDLDDVLAELNQQFIAFYNSEYGTNLLEEMFTDYDLAKIINLSKDEIQQRLLLFISSKYFDDTQPVDGAVKAIEALSRHHDLVIITARHDSLTEKTYSWVNTFFENRFNKIYFSGDRSSDSNKKKKFELCLELSVDLFIEDSLNYALESASAGINVLLYARPWNKGHVFISDANIQRIGSWSEILKYVNEPHV